MNHQQYNFADVPEARLKIREILDAPIDTPARINRPTASATESLRPWAVKPVAKRSAASVAQQRYERAVEARRPRSNKDVS